MAGEYLDAVLAGDKYSEALTLGPDFQSEKAIIIVEDNDCYVQFATGRLGQWYWNDEREFHSIQQALTVGRVIGARFRNFVPGQPAKITALLQTPQDPDFIGGVPLAASTNVTAAGWTDLSSRGSFTFRSAADAPTYIINTPADLTGVIPIGARFSLTQGGFASYFIVTAIDNGGITLYGGTNFVVANAAITQPNFSTAKDPLGFNTDPQFWSENLFDQNARSQVAPVAGTFYNIGGVSLTVPIGAWSLEYMVSYYAVVGGGTNVDQFVTLATVNNAQTDAALTCYAIATPVVGGANSEIQGVFYHRRNVTIAAKTTYFLNTATVQAGVANIGYQGNSSPTIIRAVCAYL